MMSLKLIKSNEGGFVQLIGMELMKRKKKLKEKQKQLLDVFR